MSKRKAKQEGEAFYETKEFKALNKKWHRKLKKSGFEDAEEFDSPLELMKEHHNTHFRLKFDNHLFEDRQRYYELARQLVYTYPFESNLERRVWEKHADGVPERKIGKSCRCSYAIVRKIVRKVKLAIKRDAKDILQDIDLGKPSND